MSYFYVLLNFYSFFCEWVQFVTNRVEQAYNDAEMVVLNNTFVVINYYDMYYMKKYNVRNNTRFDQLCWLYIKKYVLGLDITHHLDLSGLQLPDDHDKGTNLVEVVYYKNRKQTRYFIKTDELNDDAMYQVTQNLHAPMEHCQVYDHATVNDKYNITEFINEHRTSFNEHNQLTTHDIVNILAINAHKVPSDDENTYIKLITIDDDIEETIFPWHSVVLCKQKTQ